MLETPCQKFKMATVVHTNNTPVQLLRLYCVQTHILCDVDQQGRIPVLRASMVAVMNEIIVRTNTPWEIRCSHEAAGQVAIATWTAQLELVFITHGVFVLAFIPRHYLLNRLKN